VGQFGADEPAIALSRGGADATVRHGCGCKRLVESPQLVGDTTATMASLMGGRSLTGSELAYSRASRGQLERAPGQVVMPGSCTSCASDNSITIASPRLAGRADARKHHRGGGARCAGASSARARPRQARASRAHCYGSYRRHSRVAIDDALAARNHVVLTDEGGELDRQRRETARALRRGTHSKSAGRRSTAPCLD